MRVIAGKFKSRAVKPPKGWLIRPTSDKVKGALFNMLEPLEGCSVLDLYAGTGNLGIEAISRGASEVTFVDKESLALKLIRENLESLGVKATHTGDIRILHSEVTRAFHLLKDSGRAFDIILADPPYEQGILKRIQALLVEYPILKPAGILAVEHGSKDTETVPDFPHSLVRQRKYGDTLLTLFRRAD